MSRRPNNLTKVCIIVLVLLLGVCGLVGCRPTDAFKHINYTQESTNVDTDNPIKYLINDPGSEIESSLVSGKEVDKKATPTDEQQNLVVFSSNPNTDKHKAKKSVFSLSPDFTGLEASDGVKLAASKKTEKTIDKDTVDEAKEKNESSRSRSSKSTSKSSDDKGTKAKSGKGKKGNDDSEEKGKGQDGKKKESDTDGDGGAGGDVPEVDTTSKYTEPKKVDAIAAFGELGTIVQMVGGKGALVAADKELLSSDFSKVFADEGASSIETGWSDDGSAQKINVDKIIDSGAKTILVSSGSYQNDLSNAQKKKLKNAGITFTVVNRLSNSTYIKQTVRTVGKMLSEAKGIGNESKTEKIASDYADYHDEVISNCVDANGGKLAGFSTYETKNSKRYSYNENARYTLLVDYYDDSAEFTGVFGGSWTPQCDGIGISTFGYGATPSSFYIQAGGLINNAAVKGTQNDTGTIPVWQFNSNSMTFVKSKWSFSSSGEFTKTDSVKASAWGQVLLTTGVNASGYGVGSSFGTDTFPTIIVCSKSAKNKIINNSAKANGAYHPYDLASASQGGIAVSYFGKKVGNNVCQSSIGVDGSESGGVNTFSSGKIDDSSVHVNPKGMASSWMKGSAESFLEAAWVNDVVQENSSQVDVEKTVRDFYSEFYRHSLSNSELSSILSGE